MYEKVLQLLSTLKNILNLILIFKENFKNSYASLIKTHFNTIIFIYYNS